LKWLNIQALGLLDGDLMQRAAAARTGLVRDIDENLGALQMPGQMTEQTLSGSSAPAACVLGRAGSGLVAGRRSLGDLLLDIFQGELELLGVQALRLGTELCPVQLFEHKIQPLAFGLGLFKGSLEVIAFGH
jgi:hypothetical protein